MDFEKQLQQAIERGQHRQDAARSAQKMAEMTRDELRLKHTDFRLKLSEHIEAVLKKLADHFPGFQYETVYGEKGWGGAISRDDLRRGGSFFSRLEIVVRPLGEFPIVALSGKGTIRNRELFNWSYHEEIPQASMDTLQKAIDGWILGYAEQFAAH